VHVGQIFTHSTHTNSNFTPSNACFWAIAISINVSSA
jgi:hypothetical protein